MEVAGPKGPDSGAGIIAAIILWSVVSLIFFIANAGLAIGSTARGRSATKPLIACARPIVCIVLRLLLEPSLCGEGFRAPSQPLLFRARWFLERARRLVAATNPRRERPDLAWAHRARRRAH